MKTDDDKLSGGSGLRPANMTNLSADPPSRTAKLISSPTPIIGTRVARARSGQLFKDPSFLISKAQEFKNSPDYNGAPLFPKELFACKYKFKDFIELIKKQPDADLIISHLNALQPAFEMMQLIPAPIQEALEKQTNGKTLHKDESFTREILDKVELWLYRINYNISDVINRKNLQFLSNFISCIPTGLLDGEMSTFINVLKSFISSVLFTDSIFNKK